jgi:hypothetical protein
MALKISKFVFSGCIFCIIHNKKLENKKMLTSLRATEVLITMTVKTSTATALRRQRRDGHLCC